MAVLASLIVGRPSPLTSSRTSNRCPAVLKHLIRKCQRLISRSITNRSITAPGLDTSSAKTGMKSIMFNFLKGHTTPTTIVKH